MHRYHLVYDAGKKIPGRQTFGVVTPRGLLGRSVASPMSRSMTPR
jgi:hypothetical protein